MSDADRVRWRCRRGMLELDLVLTAFLDRHFATLAPQSIEAFCTLLERPDPELLDFVMGREEPLAAEERKLVALLRAARPHNMVQLH